MRSEIGKGVTWMVVLRVGLRMLSILSTVILARLLTPEDFGLIAMAMSVIAVIELVTALGFDVPLIAKDNPARVEFDTAWTLTIIVYVGCALVIAMLSLPMSAFFGEPRLAQVLLVAVLGWVLRGFQNIGVVEFRRKMNFEKEFIFNVSMRLVGFVVTVTLALVFRSYWALIAGMLATNITGLILSYSMAPYRPRFALGATRELMTHSKWLLSNNALLIGVVRFPHFLIGRVLGTHSLGIFTLSYDIATMPATEISAPVNRAAFPGYSRMASDPSAFKRTFLDIGSLVLLLALPAGLGLALVADELVLVALGEKWISAAPIIKILSVSAVFVAAGGNNGMAHLALGYTKAVTMQSALRLGVLILLSMALIDEFGTIGIAVAELIGAIAGFLASFPLVFRRLNISYGEYVSRIWRPIFASFAMFVIISTVRGASQSDETFSSEALALLFFVSVGVVVYSVSLGMMWWLCGRPEGAERILVNKAISFTSIVSRERA